MMHTMGIRMVALGTALIASLLATPAADAAPAPTLVGCNQTISVDTVLKNNLTCAGPGLVIDTDGVTLDLNGHHITQSSPTADTGIEIISGVDEVIIRNGVVRNYNTGITLANTNETLVTGVLFTGNKTALAGGAADNRISRNVVTRGVGSGTIGFNFAGATRTLVARNEISAVDFGVLLDSGATFNTIDRNTLTSILNKSIAVSQSSSNTIKRNRITLGGNGVEISATGTNAANNNKVLGNTVTHSSNGVHINGTSVINSQGPASTKISGNNLSRNLFDGVRLTTGITTLVQGNRIQRNGENGINALVATATLSRNNVSFNGFEASEPENADSDGLGINAPVGTLGTKNVAKGNDDPDGCSIAAMCKVIAAPPPAGTFVTCDFPVTQDIKLANDVYCDGVGQDGLIVGADDVTIDLNGHLVQSTSGIDRGIDNSAGHENLTVKNGSIAGWGTDIYNFAPNFITGPFPNGLTIDRVLSARSNSGVFSFGGADVRVTRSTFVGHENEAIVVTVNGDGANILSNRVLGTHGNGIEIDFDARHARIVGNRVVGVEDDGIRVAGDLDTSSGHADVISRNSVLGAGEDGIAYDAEGALSDPVRITGNRIKASAASGIGIEGAAVNRYSIAGNSVGRSSFYGITVVDAESVRLTRNVAVANGDTGIYADLVAIFDRNIANVNGFDDSQTAENDFGLGLLGPPGSTKGTNSARGNDHPAQCIPSTLC